MFRMWPYSDRNTCGCYIVPDKNKFPFYLATKDIKVASVLQLGVNYRDENQSVVTHKSTFHSVYKNLTLALSFYLIFGNFGNLPQPICRLHHYGF